MTLCREFAHAIAEETWAGWPDVDEFAPGLFWVISNNPGGMLASVEDLVTWYGVSEEAVQAAEAAGLVRSHVYDTHYAQVWQGGVENYDWLTLVCSSPAVHTAWVESHRRPYSLPPGYLFETFVREDAPLEKLQAQLRFWRPTYPQAVFTA